MIKTGIVISIIHSKAGIMTSSGEFVYIKTNKVLPNIGEIHTGQLCRKNLSLYKYAITAASIMFLFISSTLAHAYYTTVTTIVLSINPSVSLEANRWNKIISSKALDSNGSLILNNIKIKNKSIDEGLELLLREAKIENFINDEYVNDKKIISVHIKSNKDRTIDVSNFKKNLDSNNLKIKINVSSDKNNKIDIIANNKKINTTNSIPKSNRKKTTDNKSNPLGKPSVDTNIIEDKSSEIKKEFKKITNPTMNKENKINKDGKSNKHSTNDETSSTIKYFDVLNKIEENPQNEENKTTKDMEITNNDEDDKQFEKHSDSNENIKKNDNVFDKFVEDSND